MNWIVDLSDVSINSKGRLFYNYFVWKLEWFSLLYRYHVKGVYLWELVFVLIEQM